MKDDQNHKTDSIKPSSYQPSQAELKEQINMPGADMETLRDAFFKPLKADEATNA